VESSGSLTELDRVKLSSRISGYDGAISWAGNSLAIITGDLSVRVWDIDTSDNFLLPTDHASIKNLHTKQNSRVSSTEIFSSIAYCPQNQTLCAGTNQGSIYVWKKSNFKSEAENGWQLTDVTTVRGAIKQSIWGVVSDTLSPCIVCNCISNVYILKEQPLMSYHTREIWATQRSANQVLIENSTQQTTLVTSDISITNLCLTDMNLILTNGKAVMVYKIQRTSQDSIDQSLKASNEIKLNDNLSARFSSTFNCENLQIFIHEQNVICVGQNEVTILSLNGVKLQEVSFSDHEGKPIGSDLTNKYLTIFTLNGYIKVYDVSRHELKLVVPIKNAYDLFENFGEVIMAKANHDGSFVALTIATEGLVPDGKLHVWKLETDTLMTHDFLEKDDARLPITFTWDSDDHRLLACEARLIQQSKNSESATLSESQVFIVIPSNTSMSILELEVINLAPSEQLINLCAPDIITLKVGVVGQKTLRDFVGLEDSEAETRKMVLDFSLNVAQGNLDQAFICIRSLESEAVWSNLAKMCVQTGRLDVAKICLGHLKQARSVRAVRKAIEDGSLEQEAKTAVLAIELGMIEEAETLYKKCGRFDLLNKLLQNCGRFEEALKIAENFDRVHLKNTRMKYAQWLSENGDTAGAMKMYQLTSDPVHSITQMLMEDQVALRKYMQTTTDPAMLKWYAQYIESTGDMETAFKIYQKADDFFSQVRILCFLGQLSRADSVARHSGDKSACYHLARHYENIGKYQDAIQFYTRAQTFGKFIKFTIKISFH
jgi:intraflagellar transport protein 140